jgi:hypothetical protein
LSHDIYITGSSSFVAREPGPSKEALTPDRWFAKPAKLARMDRLCALALVAADGALCDAGSPALDSERTAIVFGTAYGCHATNEDYYRGFLKEGLGGASPRLFAYTLPSSPVGEISIHYAVRGPATTAAPGLHAGIAAIAEGVQHLQSGRADRVICVVAEVASELLQRLRGGAARDCAAAVILERHKGKARVISVDEQFPGVPSLPTDTLACSPLLELARWIKEPAGRLTLSCGDPAGGAATIVVEA